MNNLTLSTIDKIDVFFYKEEIAQVLLQIYSVYKKISIKMYDICK